MTEKKDQPEKTEVDIVVKDHNKRKRDQKRQLQRQREEFDLEELEEELDSHTYSMIQRAIKK